MNNETLFLFCTIYVAVIIWLHIRKNKNQVDIPGFTTPSVKLIKKHKGIVSKDTHETLLSYSYMCRENPTYLSHMDLYVSLGLYMNEGANISKSKSAITAIAAFYGNLLENDLVQHNQMTADIYATLEQGSKMSVPVIDRELPITNSDINSDYAATYLDEYCYTPIVALYNEFICNKEKIPHPFVLYKQLNNDATFYDVKSIITAYSAMFNKPVPEFYHDTGIGASSIIKCVKIVKIKAENVADKREAVKPTLQVVK